MLDEKLLEILVCSKCHGELKVLPDHSALDCNDCKLRFMVENSIPNMLIPDALQLKDNGVE
ncbi:Trm112 family protein [bacterium]|nr:Trm112 family protein [bacterium]MBT7311056.1 Trm112 family protein [bacterium]